MIALDDPKLNEKLLYNKWYYQDNKERLKKESRRRNIDCKEQISKHSKKYYIEHRDFIKEKTRLRRLLNIKAANERSRKYYYLNKERLLEKNSQYRKLHPEICRLSDQKRRAAKNGVNSEQFYDIEIFERDNWICGICGKEVEKSLEHLHPYSVNLDHIIPLSKGGGHTKFNTQCSHRICNMKKFTKLPDIERVVA